VTSALRRPSLWTALTRTVRPTYGARRNAADGLRDVRHDRSDRAQAMAVFAQQPAVVEDRRG
jgi:hypothetical protein